MGFVSVLLILFFSFFASAQMPGSGPAFWKFNGTEYGDPIENTAPLCLDSQSNVAVEATPTRLIIGGQFTKARTCTGSLTSISKTTSLIASGVVIPKVDGYVDTIISDGAGGWYIGGSFTKADGLNRDDLARINSDGSVNSTFTGTTFNNPIQTLLLDGNDLYVGGTFNTVSGTIRYGLAKVDATTGAFNSSWNAGLDNSANIKSLVKLNGKIHVAGAISSVNGQKRRGYVVLDPATAVQDPIAFGVTGTVETMKVVSNTLFIGGTFGTAGYSGSTSLVNASSGTQVSGFPYTNGTINSMISDDNGGWYIGGTFTNVGGVARNRVAQVAADGTVTSWNPNANNWVQALHKKGSLVYISGQFSTINGVPRDYLAAINISDASITSWNPILSGGVPANITSYQDKIIIAGGFNIVNGELQSKFAILDETTGANLSPSLSFDNTVTALHVKNDKLYLGGTFSTLGRSSYGAPVDTTNGLQENSLFPIVNGFINTAIPDDNGGWYIGGQFTRVGSVSRTNLAHIQADRTVSNWNPVPNGTIYGLTKNGSNIYVSGDFYNLNGVPQEGLSMVTTSGTLVTSFSFPAIASNFPTTSVYDNGKLYVGGNFSPWASSLMRHGLAVVDAVTGAHSEFNFSVDSTVSTLKIIGSKLYAAGAFAGAGYASTGLILNTASGTAKGKSPAIESSTYVSVPDGSGGWYIGGGFTKVNGVSRNRFAHILSDGSVGSLNLNPNNIVRTLYLDGTKLYISGSFTSIGGVSRNYIARVDTGTGLVDDWNPYLSNYARAIRRLGSAIYLGGDFTAVSGTVKKYLASVDEATAVLLTENNSVDSNVFALEDDGTNLFIGGAFTTIGRANNAQPISSSTGLTVLTDFPYVNGAVRTTTSDDDGGWYIGGDFTAVGGLTRNRAAHITSAGTVSSWNPNLNGTVYKLIKDGTYVYVGGAFTTVSGTSRRGIARVDATTSTLDTGWLPNAISTGNVYELLLASGTLFVGGNYSSIGVTSRNSIASVDIASGTVNTAFNAGLTSSWIVSNIKIIGSTIYFSVGSSAANVGGQTRTYVAAVDSTTGAVTTWAPNINNNVNALAVSGSVIYLGGQFSTVNGSARNRIASVDTAGTLQSWNPNANNTVTSIALNGSNLLVAGNFSTIGGGMRNAFAEINPSGTATTWEVTGTIGSSGETISAINGSIFVGGILNIPGGISRNRVASINTVSATVNSWNPNANNIVRALARSDSTLYIGGNFTNINSSGRTAFAAIDKDTATVGSVSLTAATGYVSSIALDGNGNAFLAGTITASGAVAAKAIALVSLTTGLSVSACPLNALSDTWGLGTSIYNHVSVQGNEAFISSDAVAMTGYKPRTNFVVYDLTTKEITDYAPNPSSAVYALESDGTNIYVGGNFTTFAGQSRNRFAAFNKDTLALSSFNPAPNNTVNTLAIDGSKLYVGGAFTTIATQPRNRAAAFSLIDNSLQEWNPDANGTVLTISPSNGWLYLGGTFTMAGGAQRSRLASIDLSNYQLSSWDPPDPNNTVNAIDSSGSKILVGGQFTNVSGTARNYLAGFDETTAALDSTWTPSPNNSINDLVVVSGTAYIAGAFTNVNSTTRNRLAAVDTVSGALTSWNPGQNGTFINSIGSDGQNILIDGDFDAAGLMPRAGFAAFDLSTNYLTPLTLDTNAGAAVIAMDTSADQNVLYLAGSFTSISGTARGRGASYDFTTQALTSWNPSANNSILSLVVDGTTTYLAGAFTLIHGVLRNYLAASNVTNNSAFAWNPDANATVLSLIVDPDNILVGGSLNAIGNATRNRILAVDTTTGNLTTWNPNLDNVVSSLAPGNGQVYVGGYFNTVGGKSKSYLTAIDSRTGMGNSMNNITPSQYVTALYLDGNTLYVGGNFTTFGGQSRNRAAAINLTTNTVLPWNPNLNGVPYAFAKSATELYIGGAFTTVSGGTVRNYLASVDPVSGTLNAFNPSANSSVQSLIVSASTLYVGGGFTTISSVGRGRLAAYNTADNSILNWTPNANAIVYGMALSGSKLYLTGGFTQVNATTRNGAAAINVADASLDGWNPNRATGTANHIYVLSNGAIAISGNGALTTSNIPKTGFSVIDSILAGILY